MFPQILVKYNLVTVTKLAEVKKKYKVLQHTHHTANKTYNQHSKLHWHISQ